MAIASALGVVSWMSLGLWPVAALNIPAVTLLLFLGNYSIASPDVMVDASVAEKSKEAPKFASSLQTLCWTSFGVFKIFSLLLAPVMYNASGASLLFGVTTLTAFAVTVPAASGWMGEARVAGEYKPIAEKESETVARNRKPLIVLACVTAVVSLSMGFVSAFADEKVVGSAAVFVVSPVVVVATFCLLRRVSLPLAKACVYIFLSSAVQPSSPILFYWMRDTPENRAAHLPCFSPTFIATIQIVGYVFFVFGTLAYNRWLSHWSYKRIYCSTQVLMCLLNLTDLAWVRRANLAWGISDQAFVLGSEVVSPVCCACRGHGPLTRALAPVGHCALEYNALVCAGVDVVSDWQRGHVFCHGCVRVVVVVCAWRCAELTLPKRAMGLSNFGGTVGELAGVGLMHLMSLDRDKYDNLPDFVVVRSLCQLLPLLLLWLLPSGSPAEPNVVATGDAEERDALVGAELHAVVVDL